MINFSRDAEFSNKLRLATKKTAPKQGEKKKRFGVNGPVYEML